MCGKWDRNDKVSFLETADKECIFYDVVHAMYHMVTKLTGLQEAIQLLAVWQTDDGSPIRSCA